MDQNVWNVGKLLTVTFEYPLNINLIEIRYFVSFYGKYRCTRSQIVDLSQRNCRFKNLGYKLKQNISCIAIERLPSIDVLT